MQFGEKIKAAREAAGMTQKGLADAIGVSSRTIQLYEANDHQPKNATGIINLAHALGVETEYFLSTHELDRIRKQEAFLAEATDKYGTRGKAQARLILDQTSALFSSGDLDEGDKEAFFQTMSEIYFKSKKNTSIFSHKKQQKSKDK